MKKLLFLSFVIGLTHMSYAQLVQLDDTSFNNAQVKTFIKAPGLIFYQPESGGLFKSSDKGVNWNYSADGIDSFDNQLSDVVYFKDSLYALNRNSYYPYPLSISGDGGQTWGKIKYSSHFNGLPTNRGYEIVSIEATDSLSFMLIKLQPNYNQDTFAVYLSHDARNWSFGQYFTNMNFGDRAFLHIHDTIAFL